MIRALLITFAIVSYGSVGIALIIIGATLTTDGHYWGWTSLFVAFMWLLTPIVWAMRL